MILQKRVERALALLREKAGKRESAAGPDQEICLEKGDKTAMILSAFLVILPAALIALIIMVGIGMLWVL